MQVTAVSSYDGDETPEQFLSRFKEQFNGASSRFYESAVTLAAFVKKFPEKVEWFCESIKWPESRLMQWARIPGRIASDELLLSDKPWTRSVKMLTLEGQRAVLDNPVAVLVDKGEVMQMDVRNLTPELVEQVIDKKDKKVRTPAEQRAWRETKAMKVTEPPRSSDPYRIVKGRVITTSAVNFSLEEFVMKHKRDIMKILAGAGA